MIAIYNGYKFVGELYDVEQLEDESTSSDFEILIMIFRALLMDYKVLTEDRCRCPYIQYY